MIMMESEKYNFNIRISKDILMSFTLHGEFLIMKTLTLGNILYFCEDLLLIHPIESTLKTDDDFYKEDFTINCEDD
jgi:hypothetical protein